MVIAFLMMNPFHHKLCKGIYDSGGEYNGYVAFDGNLPLSYQGGKSWGDDDALDAIVDVHGGITFDRPMTSIEDCPIIPITNIPDPKTLKKYRVVGFDTLHYDDSKDKWPIESVKAETLRLKEQIEKLLEK